jgi:hypothetical protein
MTNHPNRNWRRRWSIDRDAATATHNNGLVVRLVTEAQYGDMPFADIGGYCHDGQIGWIALCVLSPGELNDWIQAQLPRTGSTRGVERYMARLMREAASLWAEHRHD